jgi:hypothetical protein
MTGTDCGLFTHNQSRSYLNHLVIWMILNSYMKGSMEKEVYTVSSFLSVF